MLLATSATRLLHGSARSCCTGPSDWRWSISHQPSCTRPFSTKRFASDFSLFSHAFCLEFCRILTAPEPISTTRFSLLLRFVKSGATATNQFLGESFMTRILVYFCEKTIIIQKSVVAAMSTFHRSRKDNRKAAQTRLRHSRTQVSTSLGASCFKNTPEPTTSAVPVSLSLSSKGFSGSVSLRCSDRLRPQIPALVVEVSSDDYDEAEDNSRMIIGQSHDERDETPRPTKKRELPRKEHKKTRAHAPVPQIPLPATVSFGSRRFRQAWLAQEAVSSVWLSIEVPVSENGHE